MSANSNNQGRAYEYAWINTLFQTLNSIRETGIVCNSSYDANERAWNAISGAQRELYAISANAAVDTIIELEPLMEEDSADSMISRYKLFGSDSKGLYLLDQEYAGRVYTAPSLVL